MFLKTFYDNPLAQTSYLVGCAETGEALVIDPARDIAPYLQAAREQGLRITHVAETHIHADFVSGLRELAAATGATIYLSDMGGDDWKYTFGDPRTVWLHDGDSWMVGYIKLEALHTPGHTPEHLIFQLTDTKVADKPMGLFTGDCLFVGSVGRPDLLEVTGVADSAEQGARDQFRNVQRLKTLPDYLQVWPGHGAGSACGKALGALPSSTLGYEKLFNPAFQINDEAEFVKWLLADQPEVPRYFSQMKQINKQGSSLLADMPAPAHVGNLEALNKIVQMFLVFDTRSITDFAARHVPGSINVPATSDHFNSHIGWYVDYDLPTYLITAEADLPHVLTLLRAIGVDDIPGYFTPDIVDTFSATIKTIAPEKANELLTAGKALLLDVRAADEYRAGHIAGARHLPMGVIFKRLEELPSDQPLIVQCGGGLRSQVVASLLQRVGYTNVHNLHGGIEAWKQAGLPLES